MGLSPKKVCKNLPRNGNKLHMFGNLLHTFFISHLQTLKDINNRTNYHIVSH